MADPWAEFRTKAPDAAQADEWAAFRAPAAAPAQKAPDERDSWLGKIDAAVRGAADALTFGFSDELTAPLYSAFGLAGDTAKELDNQRAIDKADSENRFGYRLAGQLGGGVAGGMGLARSGLSPAAAAINAGWKLPMVAGASGLEGAALGAAYGFGSGEGIDDRLSQAQSGAISGGIVGAAAPVAISTAQRLISPFQAPSERAASVTLLQNEGVPLTAGQSTGSRPLRWAESALSDLPFAGGGAQAADESQKAAFNAAVLRRVGEDAQAATPEVLQRASERIGGAFRDLSARNALKFDNQFSDDIVNAMRDYSAVLKPDQKEGIFNTVGALAPHIQEGSLPGDIYQATRSRLSRQAKGFRQTEPEYANALRSVRDALDSAMARSVSLDDRAAWDTARRQWGNLKSVEKAAAAGGESAALGNISPAQLRSAIASGNNRSSYARGQGDFAELARAANAVMSPLPNSGTAARSNIANLLMAAAGGGGALAGGAPGLVAGVAGPAVVGRALMSGPVQRYLANQTATQITPEMRAIANALLNYEGSISAPRLASPR